VPRIAAREAAALGVPNRCGGAEMGVIPEVRRQLVKGVGRALLRGLDPLLARASAVPDDPVLEIEHFPWAPRLQPRWPALRAELDALLARVDALPAFREISPDQARIAPDGRWRTFAFYIFGERCELNCRRCPETAALLEEVPGLQNAFFSILAPGTRVPVHRGVTKALLRGHLALRVPEPRERCVLEVAGRRCTWREGDWLFFDDTCPHGVTHDGDGARAVLFLDFERPMAAAGRRLGRILLAGLRRTRYHRDALANQRAWERASLAFWPEGWTAQASPGNGASPASRRRISRM